MSFSPESIDEAWLSLHAAGRDPDFPISTVRLTLDYGYGPVRLGVGPDGTPQLLVPTAAGRRLPSGLSGRAVDVRTTQYLVQGRRCDFIEVRSMTLHLEDVFRRLVDEILRRLATGAQPEQAVGGAIKELRDLLRAARAHGPDFLVGLFGELTLLRSLLELSPDAARSWTGPDPFRHDFSGLTICAEVKTSQRLGSTVVHISSLEQLEPPSDGRALLLAHFAVEPAGSGGQSLHDLLNIIYSLSSDTSVLDHGLSNLDIDDWRNDASFASARYGVVSRDIYRVTAGFPRIARSSFAAGAPPHGVTRIAYQLDLAHAAAYRATDEDSLLSALAMT